MKLKKGSDIVFYPAGEFRFKISVMGKVVGLTADIKRMWPLEYSDLPDDTECYLVRRNIPAMGIIRHYILFPEEIMRQAN